MDGERYTMKLGPATGWAPWQPKTQAREHAPYDYEPPPIPALECDWQWVHEDYDGPEDNRCGHAPSLEAAKADIDFWHEENGDAG